MRKLMVILLVALASMFIFAEAESIHITNHEAVINKTITVNVYQWIDLTYKWLLTDYNIEDYQNYPATIDVLKFTVTSNNDVEITADVNIPEDLQAIDANVLFDGAEPEGNTIPANDSTEHTLSVQINSVPQNLPAGTYEIQIELTFSPTVTF
ncbi:hypothetical protein HNP65_001891 [Thermosipho japonicus]|uniref:Uncharacterized protein n=1 Tax=Thermosipho japonicus TaxID=90323 RepID=A0A841GUT5_9BACT|nr:hypothetical protein [Thermosipho japonicus]MBB6063420.1 hypothetical protein [Thermosipho japonicus]